MQIKTRMRFNYIPIRMAIIYKTLPHVPNDMDRLKPSFIAGGKIK